MREKGRLWLERGTRLLWIVWPEQKRIEIWPPDDEQPRAVLSAGDMLDGGSVLPGSRYPVDAVFRAIGG